MAMWTTSREAIRGFRQGLTSKSAWIAPMAFACAVLTLVTLEWFVASGAYTVFPENRFLRNRQDHDVHVSYRIGWLKRNPPANAAVYLLGGSSMMECFKSEEALAQEIQSRYGASVDVHLLARICQPVGAMIAVADNLPAGQGIIGIGVGPTVFGADPSFGARQLTGRMFLLRSDRLRDLCTSTPGERVRASSILPGILSYANHYARRRIGRPPVAYRQHSGRFGKPFPQETREFVAKDYAAKWLPKLTRNCRHNAALLEGLLTLAADRGFKVVLIEMPHYDAITSDAFAEMRAQYRPICEELGQDFGVPYIDWRGRVDLSDKDFADCLHLSPTGRVKYQAWLASELGALCRQPDETRRGP